jgi:hypothetical protein
MADSQNGTGLESRLNEFAVGLRQIADQEEAELAELERRVKAKRKSVARVYRAIKELTGEEPPSKKKEPKPKGTPRESTLKATRDAVDATGDEGITLHGVIEATGLSHDAVRRALEVLRERDMVRLAGKNENRAHVFKAMPSGDEIDLPAALAGSHGGGA